MRLSTFTALAAAALPVVASAQQFTLQKTNSIALSSQFFGSTDVLPGSAYGTVPLSLGFDPSTGTAFVGGYHSDSGALASNSVGIVRVDGVLGTSPTLNPLASTVFAWPNLRGIDAIDTFGGNVYYGADSGVGLTSRIGRIDANGNAAWTLTEVPDGVRIGALAVDPRGAGGTPTVSYLARSQGRLLGLDLNTGSYLFGITGGSAPTTGPVVTATPAVGFTPRSLTFDSAGNIAYGTGQVTAGTGGGFAYGNRVGDAQFQTLAGSAGLTGSILKNQLTTNSDNVGNGIAIAEKLNGGTASLLAVAGRIGGDGTLGFAGTFTDSTGGVRAIDSRNVYITNLDGSITGLSQTALAGDEDGIGTPFAGEAKHLQYGLDAAGNPVLLVLSLANNRLDVYQLEPTWTAASGGTWGDTGNWRVGLVPDSALLNARFGDAIGATPAAVSLNDARTVKNLKFDNANAAYTIGGSGTLTIDAPTGVAGQITAVAGNHTVNVPILLNKDLNIRVNRAQDTLTLANDIAAAGRGITKRGPGTAVVKNIRASALNVAEGTLRVAPSGVAADGVSRTADLAIANDGLGVYSAQLDITNNGLIVATTTPAEVEAALLAGRAGGSWTGQGLTSSSAAANSAVAGLGIANAAELGLTSFLGQTVAATDTLVRYTRLGDANLDGTTGLGDFSLLGANYNQAGGWSKGDFNYDGTVGLGDFSLLAANYNQTAPASLARPGAVPEPATLSLIGVAALGLVRRRR